MDDPRGGYTVVEVFIVLAVSGAILFGAIALFSGKQSQAQFNQAMQDLDSNIKAHINDVSVGLFPAAENYRCSLGAGDRPVLTQLPSGTKVTGSNQDCIYLGKAIQVNPGTSTITIHTVLGNRTYDNAGTRLPVTNFNSTLNPEPAPQLQETFDIAFRAGTLVKSWVDNNYNIPPNQSYDMAGYYSSLQSSTVREEQGSQALLTKAYRVLPNGQNARDCIREENNSCQTLSPGKWTMCFLSYNNRDRAMLAINATPAGVQTELTIQPDSAVCPG